MHILEYFFLKCFRSNNEENRGELIKKDSLLRSQGFNTTNITIPDSETDFNVYVYGGVISSVFVFGLLRALMYFKVAVDAAKHLHNRMFRRLLRVPIRFFDTNPVGKSMKDVKRRRIQYWFIVIMDLIWLRFFCLLFNIALCTESMFMYMHYKSLYITTI